MNEDWQDCIDAYLEGTASPKEVEALDRALLEDEELRLRFLVTADLMAELPAVLRTESLVDGMVPAEGGEREPKQNPKPKAMEHSFTWRSFAIAASVAVAPFVLFFVLGPSGDNGGDPDSALRLPAENQRPGPPSGDKVPANTSANLVLVEGAARFDGVTLSVGESFAPPGRLTVETDGAAVFHYPDGSVLTLEESVTLRLKETAAGKQLFLHEGALVADMQPQVAGSEMIIETPNSKVTVIGTRYRLATTVAEDVLEVEHGKVRLEEKQSGEEHIAETGSAFRVAGVEANKVSGTLVWHPAGWRPATKDAPQLPAKEYEVQRSWFTEDFEPTQRKGFWEVSAHDTATYLSFDEPGGDAALVQSLNKRGLPTNALRLSHPLGSGHPVGLRLLLNEVSADHFFLQYDWQPVGNQPFDLNPLCLDLPDDTGRQTIYEQGGPDPLVASDVWNHVRIEYLRFWDGKQWQVEVRRHVNGEHRSTVRLKIERAPVLLFELRSGALDIDNISAGDLYPVSE